MLRLRQRLEAMYGPSFRNLFDSEDALSVWAETWAAGLAGYSADELRQGLERCLQSHPDWPPTLPQFRNLCKVWKAPSTYLPAPRDTKDRSKELAEIMKILGAKA